MDQPLNTHSLLGVDRVDAGFGYSQLPPKHWVLKLGWLCRSRAELLSGNASTRTGKVARLLLWEG